MFALILFVFLLFANLESTVHISTDDDSNSWHGFIVADGVRTDYEGEGGKDITVEGLEYAEFYHSDDEFSLCVSIWYGEVVESWPPGSSSPRDMGDVGCSSWASMDPARVDASDDRDIWLVFFGGLVLLPLFLMGRY